MKKIVPFFLALFASVGLLQAKDYISPVSVTDNSIAEWANLPAEYVVEAKCPADATLTALRSVKVYADALYINILAEMNMEDLPDLEWVPFHVYLNTDNSDATGGYGDIWLDANTDIMLEGAVFANYEPYSFQPAVFQWWGEVGGYGWEWTDPSVEHGWDDNWGALVGEGQLPIGASPSQIVDGKYIEMKLLRELIPTPAGWDEEAFGIGFDIQQYWSSVGVLPIGSPTEENPSGWASKLQVKIDPSMLPPMPSNRVEVNGIIYELNRTEKTAMLVNGRDATGEVVIPTKVNDEEGEEFVVVTIGEEAFEGSAITAVTVPETVLWVKNYAFAACDNLTSVNISGKYTHFEKRILQYSYNVKHLSAPADLFYDIWCYGGPNRLETVEITAGAMEESVVWTLSWSRGTLLSMDISAIENTELPDELFWESYKLESLKLPAQLTYIGYKTLAECVKLKGIVIPATVTEIDDRALEDCRSLVSIDFAEGSQLKRIGNWAFYNAHALQNVTIPDGVEEIGAGAFYGCTYLQNVNIPASVRAIGDNCFALCEKIAKITVDAVEPPAVEDKTFFEVPADAPVYVPDESVEAYRGHAVWGRLNIKGHTQGVEQVENGTNQSSKMIRDGQLLILRGDKTYTVTGQEIK